MDTSKSEGFRVPDCWKDDVRMASLFAEPRNESLNPHDWMGKYKFWKELILEWATTNQKLVIDIEDVKKAFCRNGKYPATLSRVLEEMSKQGDIGTEDQYSVSNNQASWTSWGVGLVKTSVVWSWKKVLSSIVEVEKQTLRYIVPSVLMDKCDQVLQLPISSSEEAIELEELTDLHPELFGDEKETHLILGHLQKTGKVAIDTSSSQTVVKFLCPTAKTKPAQLNTSVWSISPIKPKEKAVEITEVDRSLATLKRTEKLLNDEIDNLESEMNTLREIARVRVKEGSRGAAKAALYRRKQLQIVVDKRNQALVNIQTMKIQLDQSKTDSKVMEAYKIGLSALKHSFGDLSLNEDKAQDTLIELETVLEQHRDIENIMSQSIVTNEDESDLEEELKNILADTTEISEPELELPSVPIDSPARGADQVKTTSRLQAR